MKKILVLFLISLLALGLFGCKKQEVSLDQSITDFIASKNDEQFNKIKTVHEHILERLRKMNDEYSDAIDELKDDESEDNIKQYKKAWHELGGISLYFDTNLKAFPSSTFSEVNKKIVAIDDIMRDKGSSDDIDRLIDEIENILDLIQKSAKK